FFFSSRRRHTRWPRDWSSDVCSSDLAVVLGNGTITGANQTTNTSGIATVGSWTLGSTAGTNTLTATATGSGITGNPVTFTADGKIGRASCRKEWRLRGREEGVEKNR